MKYDKTIIIGRITDEPKFERLSDDRMNAIARFTLSNSTFRDGQESPDYHACVALGKQAGVVRDHLHKGDLLCIEGSYSMDAQTVKGVALAPCTIAAENITFLSSRAR